MIEVKLRIGAELLAAGNGAVFERRSPLSNEVVTRAAAATVADAIAAVENSAQVFTTWSESGPNKRRDALLQAAELLLKRADDFVDVIMAETGASVAWARFNVQGSIGVLRESASLATQVGGEVIPSDKPGGIAMTVRVPAGVVLAMAPWNAPLLLGIRAIATPLVCGNTVVLKASEVCPATHHMIGELFRGAGLPAGAVNVITHDAPDAPAIVEALIAHPSVRRVNFTGSTRIGRIVGELAGRHLKPALLELGGKAPLVILEDADLDRAADAAAFGAFMNQGQICMSTERIVVDDRIADDFAQRLAKRSEKRTVGDPTSAASKLGAVVGCAAADQIEALVADAVDKGAKLLVPIVREGNIFGAIVLDRVTPDMRVYGEESFGPIASIVRVHGEAEAVRVANDTEYGLAAAVFGRDISRTLRVARRIECGVCHINGATVSSEPQLPFGGVKASGYGRFGGKAAIDEFTDLRVLTIQTIDQEFPL